jgi:glycosyltransferase involved in cell wall biosynthesis
MIVAHLGPPAMRQGGPAGYLAQLARAMALEADGHTVLFPRTAVELPGETAASHRAVSTALRRARRTWLGAPPLYRPAAGDLGREGGPARAQVDEAWAAMQRESHESLVSAIDAGAEILFAHDTPTAEAALGTVSGDRQVWLMVHNPMPLGLYLVWCWGVPEERWETVAGYPDVRAAIDRELGVLSMVDSLIFPSPEAGRELVRVEARFAGPLGRATWLLTGASASGPRRSDASPIDERRQRGLPPAEPVGLFLGNAQPYRGLDLLIAALDLLPPCAELEGAVAVAGCPADALPFHPRLVALGHVHDVTGLLSAVDFVVNVNRFSLFDLSTIEAVEAGRPLLLSPVGGNLTFRDLGAGVVMLDGSTPADIARGLAEMFSLTPAARAALGARSRAAWESHLTPSHLRSRHLSLYDQAASRARTRIG